MADLLGNKPPLLVLSGGSTDSRVNGPTQTMLDLRSGRIGQQNNALSIGSPSVPQTVAPLIGTITIYPERP